MLSAVCRRLVSLLSGREWTRRLSDARYQMVEASRDGGGQRVLEFLAEDISDDVPESIARIDRYIRQGLYLLAMDEAQYAIEKAPSYLPIHVRMAEVMMLEGRVRQAINKYNSVAKTYRVRGENGRAASILVEVLEKAPLDVDVRRNLIDLLEGEERWEEVLEQYIELAGTYRQLGNLEKARQTYVEVERITDHVDASTEKRVEIKYEIADIDQLRMDMRRAQRVYEDIIRMSPNDERARRSLVEINLQLGNKIEGIKQLDELLRAYAKRKQVKQIMGTLEGLVRAYPDDSGLRSRLAAIYRQLGRREEAVEQLDKLADLQLEADLIDDACETIRQIIRLKPPNTNKYIELLEQLGC
jgi:tetratricopeptide (TPR) repeat protein